MKVAAIRGAITIKENTEQEITNASVELINAIAQNNSFDYAVSIVISTTADITAEYPAKAVREASVINAPLFSCIEPNIDGALKMCIRMMVTVVSSDDGFEAKHIYLGEAKNLRKDLIK